MFVKIVVVLLLLIVAASLFARPPGRAASRCAPPWRGFVLRLSIALLTIGAGIALWHGWGG